MRSLLVTNTKGGTGKTSLALAIAVEAERSGLSTIVLDADRAQRLLSALMSKRTVPAPALAEIEAGGLADALADDDVRAFDLVVIDGAPRATTDVRDLVRRVDHTLIPIGASPLDVEASNEILAEAQRAGTPFAFVVNRADARRSVVGQVRSVIGAAYPLAPTVHERADWLAIAEGAAPGEIAPRGKAAAEAAALWKYVSTQMGFTADG